GLGGEVHDHVDRVPPEQRLHRGGIGDVALDERDAAGQVGQVLLVAGVGQQVEGDDAVVGVGGRPVPDEVRPDEPGGAGHEEVHDHERVDGRSYLAPSTPGAPPVPVESYGRSTWEWSPSMS